MTTKERLPQNGVAADPSPAPTTHAIPPGTVVRLAYRRTASRWPVCFLQERAGGAWVDVGLDTMHAWRLDAFWWYVGADTPDGVIVSAIRFLLRAGVVWDGEAVEVPALTPR